MWRRREKRFRINGQQNKKNVKYASRQFYKNKFDMWLLSDGKQNV